MLYVCRGDTGKCLYRLSLNKGNRHSLAIGSGGIKFDRGMSFKSDADLVNWLLDGWSKKVAKIPVELSYLDICGNMRIAADGRERCDW